ncbi:MAG: hypothetical protein KA732_12280 [Providencia sp.]|uniref:hypothetical protein n=1 Tax=Providencia sp. TaxID=589 RepID=UPI001B768078|nr:hypothetical protein [Providencia sp.]
MDANKAMEKRFEIFRKIGQELKNAHNRSNECLPPSGLDESIYYRCEGDVPSVETALNNPWVKRTEDIGVTSAMGVKRAVETAAHLGVIPPPLQGMNFLLKSRISRNPRIMQENIEAIYLLRFVVNPYDSFAEVINIIIASITNNMAPSRKQKLSDYIRGIEYISNENKSINFNERFDVRTQVNVSVKNFAIETSTGVLTESTIRKFIVTGIITRIVAAIVSKHRSFFKPVSPRTVISRTVIVVTVIYSYGTIEKMSEAAIRLKNKNRGVYDAMDKSKITMAYYFVEEELGPLITLAASPSNAISDDAFIAQLRHLMTKYKS